MPHIPGRPRPRAWVYKDAFDHERHTPYHKMRAQANFRGEPWELTFADFCDFWTRDRWPCRGRASTDLCLIRVDVEYPWSRSNCCIVERSCQLNIKTRRRLGRSFDDLLTEAIYV